MKNVKLLKKLTEKEKIDLIPKKEFNKLKILVNNILKIDGKPIDVFATVPAEAFIYHNGNRACCDEIDLVPFFLRPYLLNKSKNKLKKTLKQLNEIYRNYKKLLKTISKKYDIDKESLETWLW